MKLEKVHRTTIKVAVIAAFVVLCALVVIGREYAGKSSAQSPTAQDLKHLARAMHGAAEQQPDEAPKDKHGWRYIIGDLGGVSVHLLTMIA